jgi:hypothetical protein
MLKRLSIGFLLLSPTLFATCAAQDGNTMDSLLNRISALQMKENGAFLKGSFPTFVSKRHKPLKRKNDCNIFYNTLIGFTLNTMRDRLSPEEQLLCDSITSKLTGVYPHFKNRNCRDDVPTYNFWRTDTAFMVPYTTWVTILPFQFWEKRVSNFICLPDDLDDTSLELLAMNVSVSTAKNVHELMQHFANNGDNINKHKKLRCIKKKYRKYGAYSVWFGRKFPMVFDMCVLCNILTYVQHYHLPYSKADSASLQLIVAEIKNRDYIKSPLVVSPYYGNTAIILYHLGRLMKNGQIPELDSLKPALIKTADSLFTRSTNPFEKILLASTLMKWGGSRQWSVVSGQSVEQNITPFFNANIGESFPYTLQRIYLAMKRGIFNYYCPAYYDTLLLEYLALKQL